MNSNPKNIMERSKRSLLLRCGAKKTNKNKVLPQKEKIINETTKSTIVGITSPIIIFRTHNSTLSSELFLFNPVNFNLPVDASTSALIELEHVNESVTVVNNEDKANRERTAIWPMTLTSSINAQNVSHNKNNNFNNISNNNNNSVNDDSEQRFLGKNSTETWICLAKACSDEQLSRTNFAISVHNDLIQKIPFINYAIQWKAKATVLQSETEIANRYGLTHLLLSFEHQYISRSDMLVINRALCNRIVYANEEIVVCGFRLQVVELLRMNESYASTLISNREESNSVNHTTMNKNETTHSNATVLAANRNDSAQSSKEQNIRKCNSKNESKNQSDSVCKNTTNITNANLEEENHETNVSNATNNKIHKEEQSQHLQQQKEQLKQEMNREKQVACGLITQHTLINYSSKSPVYYIYLELSSEMWHSTLDGRIHLCWALKKFIPHLLHELNNKPIKASPRIRVVFSGRLRNKWTWQNNTFAFECKSHTSCKRIIINSKSKKKEEEQNNNCNAQETYMEQSNKQSPHEISHDVFHVLELPQESNEEIDAAAEIECHCEAFIDAIRTSVCRRELEVQETTWETETHESEQDAASNEWTKNNNTNVHKGKTNNAHKENVLVSDLFTSSEMSNTMSGLAVILEECAEHHHNNRLLTCTGHVITIISAGNGLYRACNDVIQSICASIHDLGIPHVNLICLGRPPLHHTPLLMYNTRTDHSLRRQYHLLNNCYSMYEVQSVQNLSLDFSSSPSSLKPSSEKDALESIETTDITSLQRNDKDSKVETRKEREQYCNGISEVRCGEANVYYEIPPWLNCYCYHPIPPSLPPHYTMRSRMTMEEKYTNYNAMCNGLGNGCNNSSSSNNEISNSNSINSFELLKPEVWRVKCASALLPQVRNKYHSDNNNFNNYEYNYDNTNGVIITGVHIPHIAHFSSESSLTQKSLLEKEEEQESIKLLLPAIETNTELQPLQEKQNVNNNKKKLSSCQEKTESCVSCTWYKVSTNAENTLQTMNNWTNHKYNRINIRTPTSPLLKSEEEHSEEEEEEEEELELQLSNELPQRENNVPLNCRDKTTSVGINLLTSELTRSDNYQLLCELRLTEEWVAVGWRWSTRLLSTNNREKMLEQQESNTTREKEELYNCENENKDNSLWSLLMSSLYYIQDHYNYSTKRVTTFIEYILSNSLNSNSFDDNNNNNKCNIYDSGDTINYSSADKQEEVLSEALQCDLEFNRTWEKYNFFVQESSYLTEDNTVLVLAWQPLDEYMPQFSSVPWQILLWLQACFMIQTLPDANNEEKNSEEFTDKCNAERTTVTSNNNNEEVCKWNDKFIAIGHVQVDHSLLFAIDPVHPLHGLSGILSNTLPFNMSHSPISDKNKLAFPSMTQPQNTFALSKGTNSNTLVNLNHLDSANNENKFTYTNNFAIGDNLHNHNVKHIITSENERLTDPCLSSPPTAATTMRKMTMTPSSASVRTSQSILDNITTRRVLSRRWLYCHPELHHRVMLNENGDNDNNNGVSEKEFTLHAEHRMTEPLSELSHNYIFHSPLNSYKNELNNWRQLCACPLLPLYGTRTIYLRDAFKVIQPHQYTFNSKTSLQSTLTSHMISPVNSPQNTITGVSAFNSSISNNNNFYLNSINSMKQVSASALDREEKLLEFIKQRLQQQYQLILDTSTSTSTSNSSSTPTINNTIIKYNSVLKNSLLSSQNIPAASFKFQTSYAALEPNSKIELSIGHQVHWLKLTETLREVNISREEHCGRYSSNNALCPSLTYSFFIWNYYKFKEMSENDNGESSSNTLNKDVKEKILEFGEMKSNTKEYNESNYSETNWTLNEITSNFILRRMVQYGQISKHLSLPWETLDHWLEHHPTQTIPRLLRNALRVREVAVVLLPCESDLQQTHVLSDMIHDNRISDTISPSPSSFAINSSLLSTIHTTNALEKKNTLPTVSFEEFNKFISHRFSVHLSTQNRVSWEEDYSTCDLRILREQLERRLHVTCKMESLKEENNFIYTLDGNGETSEIDDNKINKVNKESTTTTTTREITNEAITNTNTSFTASGDHISNTYNNLLSMEEIQHRMTRMQAILVRDVGLQENKEEFSKERELSLKPHQSQRSLPRLRNTETSSRYTHNNQNNNNIINNSDKVSSCASQEERMMSVDIDLPHFYNSNCVYVLQVWWLSCAGYIVNDWFKSFIANASRVKLRAIPISCYEVDYNELIDYYNNAIQTNNNINDNSNTKCTYNDESCDSEDDDYYDTNNMVVHLTSNANVLRLQYEVTFAMLEKLILQRLWVKHQRSNSKNSGYTKEKALILSPKQVTRKECNQYIFHVINRLVCLLLSPEFNYFADGPAIQFHSRLIHSSGLCEVQIIGKGSMAFVWRENYVYKQGTLAQVQLLENFQHAVDVAIQQTLNT